MIVRMCSTLLSIACAIQTQPLAAHVVWRDEAALLPCAWGPLDTDCTHARGQEEPEAQHAAQQLAHKLNTTRSKSTNLCALHVQCYPQAHDTGAKLQLADCMSSKWL